MRKFFNSAESNSARRKEDRLRRERKRLIKRLAVLREIQKLPLMEDVKAEVKQLQSKLYRISHPDESGRMKHSISN